MLSSCPNCKKPIVVAEPGIHTCPKCNARIWLYPEDSDKDDRVLISPETLAQQQKHQQTRRGVPPVSPDLEEMDHAANGGYIPPWEQRPNRPFFDALMGTWRLSTFHATAFFTKLKTETPIKGVAFYGWLFTTLGYMFWSLYRLIFLPLIIQATQEAAGGSSAKLPDEADIHLVVILVFLASPLMGLLSIWLNAAMYHLVLMILDVKRDAFRGTLRVVSYSASPLLFLAFPFFGEFVAFIWNMVLSVIGLSRVHRLGTARAMLAVLLPPIAFYLLLLLGARLAEELAIMPYILPR